AALAALRDAGIDPREVDIVMSYAVVPDRVQVPMSGDVAHLIGARRALAVNVDCACASSLVQIEVARAYLESGLAKVAVLTQSHLMLRATPFIHPAAPGLGDAATALVVVPGEGRLRILSTFNQTHGEYAAAVTWVRSRSAEDDIPWWEAGGDFRLGSHHP